MVEIFRTNVTCKNVSCKVLQVLNKQLPNHFFNFDLDDPESILRAEVKNCLIAVADILLMVKQQGIEIDLIVD